MDYFWLFFSFWLDEFVSVMGVDFELMSVDSLARRFSSVGFCFVIVSLLDSARTAIFIWKMLE